MRDVALRIIAAVAFVVLGSPAVSFGQTEAHTDEATRIFSFAESLFGEGDYFRAVTEYKRLLYFHPASPWAEKAAFRMAEAHFRAKRWEEASSLFRRYLDRYPQGSAVPQAWYFLGIAEKEGKRYDEALRSFDTIIKERHPVYTDPSLLQKAMIYVDSGDFQGAVKSLQDVADGGPYANRAREALQKIPARPQQPPKTPAMAGTLAALLPGAGHLYVERYRDAAVAFSLNATFIAAAVELFRKDNNILGGIVTFVELGWYLGNIYSAITAAHKYNQVQRDDWLRAIKGVLSVDISAAPCRGGGLISLTRRF
ncbi:MAG: tetratricopeptide repeat protein [Syntrophales bacterium]|nr:tetratricopeptide repeat protein [Syntrophales bacterium]